MRTIIKGTEPRSLTQHRQNNGKYEDYTDKADLRRKLAAEQHGLCCYCMGSINCEETSSMKIEHWQSQTRYPDKQLDYRNLLGACMGGEGQPPNQQHCDTRKGDRDFILNPAVASHPIESSLRYELDGSIRSDDNVLDDQLEDVLNLNLPFLKNNRKKALDGLLEWWKYEKCKHRGPVPRDLIARERDRRINRTGGLVPYCQVIVWWMDLRLARKG